MNCPGCAHDNPATVAYCQRCGGRMDLTADDISASLAQEREGEAAIDVAYKVRRLLVGSVIFFLLAMTVYVFSGKAPQEAYYVPSVSNGGEYLQYHYPVPSRMDRLEIPVEEKK